MKRFPQVGWMFAALAIVAMVSQAALAQREREQGRRGRGGPDGGPPSPTRLLGVEAVQKALNVTDEQKEKISAITEQMRDDMRTAFEDGTGREKVREINDAATAKINEVLDEGQQKRLMGIFVQVNGANAALDPAVAKELNVTDDQKKKLEEAREANGQAMRQAFEGLRDQNENSSREDMRAKFDKLREEANAKLLAVLTSEQQEQLESLKGEKVEIDMSQLRGGRGFGGDRGRRGEGGERGGRGRGDRNREEPSNESKSSN